jgi:hypothetical protein
MPVVVHKGLRATMKPRKIWRTYRSQRLSRNRRHLYDDFQGRPGIVHASVSIQPVSELVYLRVRIVDCVRVCIDAREYVSNHAGLRGSSRPNDSEQLFLFESRFVPPNKSSVLCKVPIEIPSAWNPFGWSVASKQYDRRRHQRAEAML